MPGQLLPAGYSEAAIRDLETDLHQAELPGRDRRVLEFARQLARASPPPAD